VIAEYPTSQWLLNLRAHPDVQIRVDDKTFAAHARVVFPDKEPDLHREIQQLSRDKYGWGDGTIVELSPASFV
jgi:hypothetical protein